MLSALQFDACTNSDEGEQQGDDTDSDTQTSDTGSDTQTTDADPGDAGTATFNGLCEVEAQAGGFELTLTSSATYVQGEVKNKPTPIIPPVYVMTEGDCWIERKQIPQCDPTCGAGLICNAQGQCVDEPENQDIGTVTVAGLVAPVEMTPIQGSNLYFDTQLPHPAFNTNDTITLSVTGNGEVSAFSLDGKGVELPAWTGDGSGEWTLAQGQGLTINWEPGIVEDTIVIASISVNQHGVTPGSLICKGADTGRFQISAELLDTFLSLGISGSPQGRLVRIIADSTDTAYGCVEFSVRSSLAASIIVN